MVFNMPNSYTKNHIGAKKFQGVKYLAENHSFDLLELHTNKAEANFQVCIQS